MAKKRRTIGSVLKGKDGRGPSIKLSEDVSLKKGQYVNLENEKIAVDGFQKLIQEGKFTPEYGEKRIMDTTNYWNKVVKTKNGDLKIKDFVLYQLIVTEEV